jgi:hypothetical protein
MRRPPVPPALPRQISQAPLRRPGRVLAAAAANRNKKTGADTEAPGKYELRPPRRQRPQFHLVSSRAKSQGLHVLRVVMVQPWGIYRFRSTARVTERAA